MPMNTCKNPYKNPRGRNAFPATTIAIALLAAAAGAFVFLSLSHRPAENTVDASQQAAIAESPRTAAASHIRALHPSSAYAAPSVPASSDNSSSTDGRAASQSPAILLPASATVPTVPAGPTRSAGATGTTRTREATEATNENAGNSAAHAPLTPRDRAILGKIPNTRLRDELLALDPAARFLAFKSLARNPPPQADYASLHVAPNGRLYYVCQMLPIAPLSSPDADSHSTHTHSPQSARSVDAPTFASASLRSHDTDPHPELAPVPVTEPPLRHSRPGSRNTLFLDFSGGDIRNTLWNGSPEKPSSYVPVFRARPYSIDTDTTTFSDQEQRNIIEIWERVAEHFAPFDVDVTTEKPTTFTRTTGRVLITHNTDKNGIAMPHNDAGGVAFSNVFGDFDRAGVFAELEYANEFSPAFVYYNNLDNSNANVAYAASHEFGHNLGLSHDGSDKTTQKDKNGNIIEFGYYRGHGSGDTSWAPIMGAGYGCRVIQWSKGEYYGANNKEDDIAIIAGRLGYIGELAATTLATGTTAYLYPFTNGKLGSLGIIRHAAIPHYYGINLTSSGSISFTLYPFYVSNTTVAGFQGNADLKLELLDSSGNITNTNAPPGTLTAALGRSLTAGQWYVRISTEGTGDPMLSSPTGYSSYGSIGQYILVTNLVYTSYPLAPCLNSTLSWTTETDPAGAPEWFGQTTVKRDGRPAAAQSGRISQGQATSVHTTVEGTGTVSFWWKISAATNDYLTFDTTDSLNNTTTRASINGTQDWAQRTIAITTTGTHTFGWTFDKASTGATGSAWVDQVTWTPDNITLALTPTYKELPTDTGEFTLTLDATNPWTVTTDTATATWLTATPASGSGDATLTITHNTNNTPAPRRGYIDITSAGIRRTLMVEQPPHIPLSTALGIDLNWKTYPDPVHGGAKWTAQTFDTRAGRPYAARSGITLGTSDTSTLTGQKTWLEATVTGEGTLGFWWKVDSEEEEADDTGVWGDILYFYIDGMEQARISGSTNWARRSFDIAGTGTHTLQWVYNKDPYLSVGADAAWLDNVTWTAPAAIVLTLTPDTKQITARSGNFTLSVDSNVSWNASSNVSWLTLTPAAGSDGAQLTIIPLINNAATPRTGIITLTGGGTTATCTVTQAAATPARLNLTPATKEVPATGGTFTLDVDADVSWSASKNVTWLTNLTPSSGVNNGTLTLTYATNTATTARTGIVTLTTTAGGTTATSIITQAAATITTPPPGNSGGGGGGAPTLWTLLAIAALLGLRKLRL